MNRKQWLLATGMALTVSGAQAQEFPLQPGDIIGAPVVQQPGAVLDNPLPPGTVIGGSGTIMDDPEPGLDVGGQIGEWIGNDTREVLGEIGTGLGGVQGVYYGLNNALNTVGTSSGVLGTSVAGLQAACSLNQAATAAGTVMGAASGLFTGGRATAPLQVVQQVQLLFQSGCDAAQLAAQIAALLGIDISNVGGLMTATNQLSALLGQAQFMVPHTAIGGMYQQQYPDAFAPGRRHGDLVESTIRWNKTAREAQLELARIHNRVAQEQRQGIGRSTQAVAAARQTGGLRAEIQATNAVTSEVLLSLNGLADAHLAHQRAQTENQLRHEAKMEAADTEIDRFMKGFAQCAGCNRNPLMMAR